MGTICASPYASPYASIFMQKMESQILNHEPHSINFWCRFIDDCFFIFTHGEDKLHKGTHFYERDTPYYQLYLQILQNFNRPSRHQHSHWAGWKLFSKVYTKLTGTFPLLLRLQVKPFSRNKIINYLLTSA